MIDLKRRHRSVQIDVRVFYGNGQRKNLRRLGFEWYGGPAPAEVARSIVEDLLTTDKISAALSAALSSKTGTVDD